MNKPDGETAAAHVKPGDAEPSRPAFRRYFLPAALVALATAVGSLAREHAAAPDLVMVYLLVIGIAAALFGRGPAIMASALSVLAYNFFFVPPFFTFEVHDERHLLTFAMMFVVGLLVSDFTARIRRHEREARAREERTSVLYALSRDLGSALNQEQVARVTAQHAAAIFGAGAAVLLPDRHEALAPAAACGLDVPLDVQEQNAARWAFEHRRLAGLGTSMVPSARVLCMPLTSGLGVECLGVLGLATATQAPLSAEQRRFLDVFARQAALALERSRLAEEAKASALRARTEEMRSSLLSAVSHDLRTPLAAITGAATTLRDDKGALAAGQRTDLLDAICEEAEHLERLVKNLLDMTQLESGAMKVKREWVPLEEVVGAALTRLDAELSSRPVHTELPPDLPLLSVDPVLLGQVFVNLLENAGKYTPASSPIDIRARAAGREMIIEVADRGPGFPPDSESRIFEKFFRGKDAHAPGAGLGLAICRGIVEAHGGALVAENRDGGGALFRMTLPLVGEAPAIPRDTEGVGAGEESPS